MWEQIRDHEFRAAFLKIHEPLTLCFAEAHERKPVMNTMQPQHRLTPIWLDCDTVTTMPLQSSWRPDQTMSIC